MALSTTLPEVSGIYTPNASSGGSRIASGLRQLADIYNSANTARAGAAQQQQVAEGERGLADLTGEIAGIQQGQLDFAQAQSDIFNQAAAFADGVSEEEQAEFSEWQEKVARLQGARQGLTGTRYQTQLLDVHKQYVARFPHLRDEISKITGIDSPTELPENSADTTILESMDQVYGQGRWNAVDLAMRLDQVAKQRQVQMFGEAGLLTADDLTVQAYQIANTAMGYDTMLRASESYQQSLDNKGFLTEDQLAVYDQQLADMSVQWKQQVLNTADMIRQSNPTEDIGGSLREALVAIDDAVALKREALRDKDFMNSYQRYERALYNTAALGSGFPPDMIKQVIQSTLQSGNVISVMEFSTMTNAQLRSLADSFGVAADSNIITLRKQMVGAVESFLTATENMNTDLLSATDKKFHLWYVKQLNGSEPAADVLGNREVSELTQEGEVSTPDAIRFLVRREQDTTNQDVRNSISAGIRGVTGQVYTLFNNPAEQLSFSAEGKIIKPLSGGNVGSTLTTVGAGTAGAWNALVDASNTPEYEFIKPLLQEIIKEINAAVLADRTVTADEDAEEG